MRIAFGGLRLVGEDGVQLVLFDPNHGGGIRCTVSLEAFPDLRLATKGDSFWVAGVIKNAGFGSAPLLKLEPAVVAKSGQSG